MLHEISGWNPFDKALLALVLLLVVLALLANIRDLVKWIKISAM